MPCANRSILCHGLYHNGYPSTIWPIFKEYENSDTFQFWHFPILTLSGSDTFQFWHFLILTLSNSDTFQFWHFPILTFSNSDSFQFLPKWAKNWFWHFPIPHRSAFNVAGPKSINSEFDCNYAELIFIVFLHIRSVGVYWVYLSLGMNHVDKI